MQNLLVAFSSFKMYVWDSQADVTISEDYVTFYKKYTNG